MQDLFKKVMAVKVESKKIIARTPAFWPATAGMSTSLDEDHMVVNMIARATEQKGIKFVVPFIERV